jgi:hypothetical protein
MNITQLPLLQNTLPLLKTKPAISQTCDQNPLKEISVPSSQATIEDTIHTLLPFDTGENKIKRARNILGKSANLVPDEAIDIALTQFEFLAKSWLDEFERKIFEGKTLQEALQLT